ncbi:MAG: biopolymer transporter ExbD [Deltaproteobacteria bacterium]|nr:biopolymer transporter ExbD [Deltaproteobacteria bacterium]
MDEKSFDYINVIPLVDVMLVLLTIVLTGATFIVSGALPIELPKAQASQTDVAAALTIEIDAGGAIYLDRRQLDRRGLEERLSQIAPASPVIIRADAQCRLQAFVDVFDMLKTRGFIRIDLQTEKLNEQAG